VRSKNGRAAFRLELNRAASVRALTYTNVRVVFQPWRS
jgi:hypothetical protein